MRKIEFALRSSHAVLCETSSFVESVWACPFKHTLAFVVKLKVKRR